MADRKLAIIWETIPNLLYKKGELIMKGKNAYTDLYDEIKAKIDSSNQAKGRISSAVSRSDLEAMATTLLNTPDHSVTVYSFAAKDTSGTDGPVGIEKKPAKRYRDSMKPMLRALGLDKHDVDKVDDIPMSKEHAAAMMDVATTVIHDYMRAGRKFSFPITETDETRMEINCVMAPERTSVGNRFKKDSNPDDDTVVITKERATIKTKNPVPYWLKEVKK